MISGGVSRASAASASSGLANSRAHSKPSSSKRFAISERKLSLSSTSHTRSEPNVRAPISPVATAVAFSCPEISLHPFINFLSGQHGQAPCHFVDAHVTFHERLTDSDVNKSSIRLLKISPPV